MTLIVSLSDLHQDIFKICYINGSKVDTVDITLTSPARQEVPKEMKTNSSRYLEFTRNKIWITFSVD